MFDNRLIILLIIVLMIGFMKFVIPSIFKLFEGGSRKDITLDSIDKKGYLSVIAAKLIIKIYSETEVKSDTPAQTPQQLTSPRLIKQIYCFLYKGGMNGSGDLAKGIYTPTVKSFCAEVCKGYHTGIRDLLLDDKQCQDNRHSCVYVDKGNLGLREAAMHFEWMKKVSDLFVGHKVFIISDPSDKDALANKIANLGGSTFDGTWGRKNQQSDNADDG